MRRIAGQWASVQTNWLHFCLALAGCLHSSQRNLNSHRPQYGRARFRWRPSQRGKLRLRQRQYAAIEFLPRVCRACPTPARHARGARSNATGRVQPAPGAARASSSASTRRPGRGCARESRAAMWPNASLDTRPFSASTDYSAPTSTRPRPPSPFPSSGMNRKAHKLGRYWSAAGSRHM